MPNPLEGFANEMAFNFMGREEACINMEFIWLMFMP